MTNILFVRTENGNTKCSFGYDGNFIVKSPFRVDGDMRFMLGEMDEFLNDFFSVPYADKAENGYFFRFTNDKNEFSKIQDGKYTKSVNHQDKRLERGISVSNDMSYCALGSYNYYYIVSGVVIGYGSDGEPLLDAKTMEKHSPYKSVAVFCKNKSKLQKKKEMDFLEKYRWTEEQLQDLQYESLCHKCRIQYLNEDGEVADYSRWGGNPQKVFKEGEYAGL